MSIVTRSASDRLADAALILLDAAREAAKESPSYKPGETNLEGTLSLATQALVMGDHWHLAGEPGVKVPAGFQHRWMGVAHGLGVTIGLVDNSSVRTLVVLAAAQSIEKGVAVAVSTVRGVK